MKKFLLGSLLGLLISGLIVTTPANAFALHNYQTGLCLDVSGAIANGSTIIVAKCNGSPTQQWTESVPNNPSQFTANFISDVTYRSAYGAFDSWYYLYGWNYNLYYNSHYFSNSQASFQTGSSSAVIGVQAGVIADGTPLILWSQQPAVAGVPSQNGNNQLWTSVFIENDFNAHACYILANFILPYPYNPYVMGVAGGKTKPGTPVILWSLFGGNGTPDYFGHPDQYWCVY